MGSKFLSRTYSEIQPTPLYIAFNVKELLSNFAYLGHRPTTTNVGFVRQLIWPEMNRRQCINAAYSKKSMGYVYKRREDFLTTYDIQIFQRCLHYFLNTLVKHRNFSVYLLRLQYVYKTSLQVAKKLSDKYRSTRILHDLNQGPYNLRLPYDLKF